MPTYLFVYYWKGEHHSLAIEAESKEEAKQRLLNMYHADYTGELKATLPGSVPSVLVRLLCWVGNTWRGLWRQ